MILRFVNGTEAGATDVPALVEEVPLEPRAAARQSPVRIRAYRPEDRAAIRKLCCDTGFLGRPIDALYRDRELFADLFTRAYLRHQPQWALVAEAEGRVVGYLLGAVSRCFEAHLLHCGFVTASKMLLRLAAGCYADHPRSRRFVRWLLTAGFREQPRHPARAAHLHWDVEKNYRGRGVPQRLWAVYAQKLRGVGTRECYGAFFSYPGRRPELVYARYGFRVFDRKRTTLFEPELAEPVEVVCVHRAV
jgi:ribosomal protein S18 acetylase RimI-like enzyme